jgi:hypothetical protein
MAMNKKMLSVTFSVLLLISIALFAHPAKADDAIVLSSSGWIDGYQTLHIVGEVQNSGYYTISSVYVTVNVYFTEYLFKGQEQELQTFGQYTLLSNILPNEKSPFNIEESLVGFGFGDQIDNYTIGATSQLQPTYVTVEPELQIVSSNSYFDSHGDLNVAGTIENLSNNGSWLPGVYATFYDASGKVVDVAIGGALPNAPSFPFIKSGETVQFGINCTDSSQIPLIASYSLTAQSATLDPTVDYALIAGSAPTESVPTISPSFTQEPTPTPTTHNPSASPTLTPSSPSMTLSPSPSPTSTPLTTLTPSPSIPEFPLTTLTVTFLIIAVLVGVIFRRKQLR